MLKALGFFSFWWCFFFFCFNDEAGFVSPGGLPAGGEGSLSTRARPVKRERKRTKQGEGKMEEAEEDDMACGDLGNGLGRRPGAATYEGEDAQSYPSRSRKGSGKACRSFLSTKRVEENEAALPCSKRNSIYDGSSKTPVTGLTRQKSSGKANLELIIHPEEIIHLGKTGQPSYFTRHHQI